MVTRLHGTFDIVPARERTLRQLDGDRVPPPSGDFHTVVDGVDPGNYPQSSTTWLAYARDVRDNTSNVIRLEPRYLKDSPPLVPNLGLGENVFEASPEDALQGDVLCYYPGDYHESPYGWSEEELDHETERHFKSFANEVSKLSGHFLENKDALAVIEGNNVHAYICFGMYSSANSWSVLLLVAESDPLDLDDSSDVVEEYHFRNQGPTVMGGGRDTGKAFQCAECSGEQIHMKINHRNQQEEYVEGVYECQNCGNLVRR